MTPTRRLEARWASQGMVQNVELAQNASYLERTLLERPLCRLSGPKPAGQGCKGWPLPAWFLAIFPLDLGVLVSACFLRGSGRLRRFV